jgi:ferric iron reductase protein FhuF
MHISGYDWTYLWNSMWLVIITMATVGYGDFVPKTYLGRVITILACIWGNFLISLMVISLTVSSEFTNPAHRKAFDTIVRTQEQDDLRNHSAMVLQSLLRYNVTSKKYELTSSLRLRHLNQIRDRLKRFQGLRKRLLGKDQEMPMENLMLKVN